jgi:dihydroorotase
MSERIVIRGGRVMDPANGVDRVADLVIKDGRLSGIIEADDVAGARVVDATGCIVAPGFVDLHAHLREPGFEHKGTIATETSAALRGGFTTVCAMPNTDPPPDTLPVVEALLDRIERDARVRVLPIGCVTRARAGKQLADISELAEAGCVALSDDGDPIADSRLMRSALELADAAGLPLSEHSDDPVLNGGGSMNEGRVSERLGLRGQPAAAEVSAVARNIALAETTGAHIHIAHVSTARAIDLVRDAKERGVRITCEVTPSHLFMTEERVFGSGPEPSYDSNARINPPLRTETDRRGLVAALEAGIIDAVATDHAPHAIEDKLCEFELAAPGISCFETALSTMMELVHRGEVSLARVVEAMTIGPARCFQLSQRVPGIGTLQPGEVADVVVFDPGQVVTVDTGAFVSKGKNTPLGEELLHGRVVTVIAGGKLAEEAMGAHG